MKYGTPWSIAPLGGKYYGTRILDQEGNEVMKVWFIPWDDEEGRKPSERELRWEDEVCDNHYECQASYDIAKMIVEKMNA